MTESVNVALPAAAVRAPLPPVEAVDALAPEALPAFIAQTAALQAQAAALQARAAARLATHPTATHHAEWHNRWLTAEDAAALLKVPRRWVYAHREDLGGAHVGRYVRFERTRINAALKRMQELT